MFTKGGEFQVSAQIGNGFEAQSAYALTDHFALMTNFSYIKQSGYDADHPKDFHQHRLFEGGLGYFLNRNDSFVEIFAGYGRGKGSSYDEYEFFGNMSSIATGSYERYFIQPAVGMNRKEVDFAFAPRISVVDFYSFSNELTSTAVFEKPKCFFEPAIIGRGNFANNRLFITFQAGMSLGMSQDVYFERRTFQISGGLGLRLGGTKPLTPRL